VLKTVVENPLKVGAGDTKLPLKVPSIWSTLIDDMNAALRMFIITPLVEIFVRHQQRHLYLAGQL
jgi:hypothetical protein